MWRVLVIRSIRRVVLTWELCPESCFTGRVSWYWRSRLCSSQCHRRRARPASLTTVTLIGENILVIYSKPFPPKYLYNFSICRKVKFLKSSVQTNLVQCFQNIWEYEQTRVTVMLLFYYQKYIPAIVMYDAKEMNNFVMHIKHKICNFSGSIYSYHIHLVNTFTICIYHT